MQKHKFLTPLGPIILLAIYVGVVFFIKREIPDPRTFISHIQGFYQTFGYPLVFLGALFEATFILGFYVPGATIVMLGAVFSKTGAVQFPLIFLSATLGVLLGYTINYFLGRFGWHNVLSFIGFGKGIEEAKNKIAQHREKAIFLSYFFPGSGSFVSTACGIMRMPFHKFLMVSVLSQVFWSLFWGTLAYYFGLRLVEFMLKYFIYLFIVVVLLALRTFFKNRN